VLSESGKSVAPARVLLVGEDPRAATMMVEMLRDAWPGGLLVTQAARIADAALELTDHGDSCVLMHLAGTADDLTTLRTLVAAAPEAAIVVVSDRDDVPLGVAAVTAGAQDHLLRSELHPALLTRAVRYAVERKRAEVRLTRQALEDPLTGLPNRVLFLDRVGGALDRSRRTGLAPAVMFLDVDDFKEVNDSLGHGAGDRLLCTLAERFRELLRPMDTVARLGGDEFTFLFEGLSGRAEATAIARRVAEAASEPVVLRPGAGATAVAVSIGVTMLENSEVSSEDALAEADAAMYRAKSLGGGRAELFDPDPGYGPDPASAPEVALAARPGGSRSAPARHAGLRPVAGPQTSSDTPLDARALRHGLRDGQLRVHYQPRVSIDGRTGLVGFEALVRWEHPERGLVAPADFIGCAEDSGMIVEIGDWVIAQALSQVRRWRQSRPGMTISVNLSGRQLADPGLGDRIVDRLHEARTDPGVLWLEVSQAAILDDVELAADVLGELHEIGVGLAVDDCGRDDAAADLLQALPLEMLKIDRSVVARLDGTAAETRRIESVVDLGHELGLSVIAEGVETDQQLALVRALRCDGAQGYLFSRPVPEDSVRELLGTR
jgi:diguanylate cyclase (GGDEF)-like protein